VVTLHDQGLFRKDLFYRLCGAWLDLPPLRARKGDLMVLVDNFLKENGSGHDRRDIEESTWNLLQAYSFPGNIRELKSIVQHASNLAKGKSISVHHLPAYVTTSVSTQHQSASLPPSDTIVPLATMEKQHILKVYRHTGRNKLKTARLLNIGANTLRRKLRSYKISDTK